MSLLSALVVDGEPCLEGATVVTLERSAPWPADEVAAIESMMASFVAAGARSAFTWAGSAAGRSALAQVAPPLVSGDDLSFTLHATQVDARAFQILRHMVSLLEPANDQTIRRILVSCAAHRQPPRATLPEIDEENEGEQYPGELPDPGFAVVWDESMEYSKCRRVLVELATRPDPAALDELEVYAMDWARLLEGGGFALPLGLPDVFESVMGCVSQLDVLTAEIEIPVYRASESGFEVLLQMLAAYHQRIRPIQLVTIE
ncbi:MAG: hypothetical protein U0414_33250 [Polyangiaceae bacterium]